MAIAARLPIVVRRYQLARFTIRVAGIDLSARDVAMEVRLRADTPGTPMLRLDKVTTASAQGIKIEVATEGGIPVSYLKGRINKTTMAADPAVFPYAPELGSASALAYGIVISEGAATIASGGDAVERLYGDFIVEASAFGSNAAPLNREPGYGAQQAPCGSSGGSVTFGDQIVNVAIDGAGEVAASASAAVDAATLAGHYANDETDADVSGAPAGSRGAKWWSLVAKAWNDLAAKWADAAENVEVVTGKFSARHWATKAGASSIAADWKNTIRPDVIDRPYRFTVSDIIGPYFDMDRGYIRHPALDVIAANGLLAASLGASFLIDPIGAPSVTASDSAGRYLNITRGSFDHPVVNRIANRAQGAHQSAQIARRRDPSISANQLAFLAALVHIIRYGQSNSAETGAGILTLPASPASVSYFNGGDHTRAGFGDTETAATTGSTRTSLVQVDAAPGKNAGHTFFRMLAQLLRDEDGIDIDQATQKLLLSSAGVGGTNIDQLATTYFFRVQEDFAAAKTIADAAGISYAAGLVLFNQGESNQLSSTSVATYLTKLRAMQVQMESAANAASGFTAPLPMIVAQTNSHFSTASASYQNANAFVARAQLAAALNEDNANGNVALACPTYQFARSDSVHFDTIGHHLMHGYEAITTKRWLFDGVKPRPLVPSAVKIYQGAYIHLTYPIEPGRQLINDNGANPNVPVQPALGFRVFNGSTAVATTARIIGPGLIELKPASAPAAGWTVDYAMERNNGGPMGLGNVRDNQGDLITDPTGLGLRFDNWGALFSMPITA